MQRTKRPPMTALLMSKEFDEKVRVVTFLLGYKDVTEFLHFLIDTADQQLIAKPKLQESYFGRKLFFASEKGLLAEDTEKINVRFHTQPSSKERLIKISKIYGFKNYSDFILSILIEIVSRHEKEIEEYLDFSKNTMWKVQRNEVKKNPKTPILPPNSKINDTSRVQVS